MLIGSCKMPPLYSTFFDDSLHKNTLKLLEACKSAHGTTRAPVAGNDCFAAITVSHWPTTMTAPGGESYIVSHFIHSIFSGSCVEIEEKLNCAHWVLSKLVEGCSWVCS